MRSRVITRRLDSNTVKNRHLKLCHPCIRLVQASTDMSSLRGLVGKGMGSIAVEAVLKGFCFFVPPPIDYS